jgi:hypothetical protein
LPDGHFQDASTVPNMSLCAGVSHDVFRSARDENGAGTSHGSEPARIRNIDARHTIAVATAGAMLAVLSLTPGHVSAQRRPAEPVPSRPSLSVRFSGAMLSFDHPVTTAGDSHGYIIATVAGVDASQLAALSRAAQRSAARVSRNCRCDLRGYEVRARIPGRGVQVVASSAATG